jgi:hypothetical protein
VYLCASSLLRWEIPFASTTPPRALAQERAEFEWAAAQVKLGTGYLDRVDGERADNLEKAAYEAALTVRTREALPREWAETQSHLGLARGAGPVPPAPHFCRRARRRRVEGCGPLLHNPCRPSDNCG